MRKSFLMAVVLLLLTITAASAQMLFSFQMDAYKTDNRDPFEFADKVQMGLEFNYFLYPQLSLSTGVEFWSAGDTYFIPGMRFYPIDPVFLRFRPLLGNDVDYALGAGYARKITDNLRLEGMLDYYFEHSNLALRFGIGYTL
ncbi:MAG: hypothetical protein ACLFUB_17875 [Cyclobacteriaceae bacterium]